MVLNAPYFKNESLSPLPPPFFLTFWQKLIFALMMASLRKSQVVGTFVRDRP